MKTPQLATITKLIFLTTGLLMTSTGLAQTTLSLVTNGPIATDLGAFIGAAWGDFYNDGLLDLIDANLAGTNVFYRNNGNGVFTKITGQDPVLDVDYHIVAAAGDYNNDGNLDLVMTSGVGAPTPRRTLLYRNGGGSFSQVSGGTVTNQLGHFGVPVFADYDNDGFLDLFITDFGPNSNGAKNLLFHNNGDGTFSSITNGPVVNNVGVGYQASWIDYDDDGLVDLLVINRLANSRNFLYHNEGNGTFTRVITNAIGRDTWPAGAVSGVWGDYDNDGLLDLFVTDNYDDSNGVRNKLYHNNGNGAFTTNSGPITLPPSGGWSYAAAWGDYDNDGYLDLFVVNFGGNNALFHNSGDGTFTPILSGVDPVHHSGGGTCSWVDYDNDGFLDLFLSGGEPGPLPHLLYHNNGNSNAWLEVKCVGTVANRSAIGTKVRVQATIRGKTFWQVRVIGGQNLPLVAHFGLGDATNVDTLRIEWPSRTVQELHNVTPRQILTITEPARLLATTANGVPQFTLKAWPGMQFTIQASQDLTTWSPICAVTATNLNGLVPIVDTNPPPAKGRFYRALSQ